MFTREDVKKMGNWLLQFLQVQLFITLFSLPILLAWGLPISVITIVGNLIFSPFIFIFLLCSSLIFFTELMHISNGILIQALQLITFLWKRVISFGNTSWLMSFKTPHVIILILMPIMACLCVCLKRSASTSIRVTSLSALLGLFTVYMIIDTKKAQGCWELTCSKGTVHIIRSQGVTTFLDNGALKYLASPKSWIEYTLIPFLIKKTGTSHIDNYLCTQPTYRTIKAITEFTRYAHIEKVFLPYWQGKNKGMLHSYYELKQTLLDHNTQLVRIGSEEIRFDHGIVQATDQFTKKQHYSYPLLHIVFDNTQPNFLCSSKTERGVL